MILKQNLIFILINMKNRKQKGTAPFIHKLYQLVDDPNHSQTISWADDSHTFIIKDVSQFSSKLLPLFYKHSNFSSFVRQLNIYGFAKTKVDSTQHIYYNSNFDRGSRNKLRFIKRRPASQRGIERNQTDFEFKGSDQNGTDHNSVKKDLTKEITESSWQKKEMQDQNQVLVRKSCSLIMYIFEQLPNFPKKSLKEIKNELNDRIRENTPNPVIFEELMKNFGINFSAKSYQNHEQKNEQKHQHKNQGSNRKQKQSKNQFGWENRKKLNDQNMENNNQRELLDESDNKDYFSNFNNLQMKDSNMFNDNFSI